MASTPIADLNTVRGFTLSPQMNTDRTQITSLCNPVAASRWEARLKSVKDVAHRATATAIPSNDCNKNPRKSVASKASVFSHELLNLTYDTIEFVDEI